jgi:hypothetical protein
MFLSFLRPARELSTVNDERVAGDERRPIRTQPDDGVGDLPGRPEAPHGLDV